MITLKVFHAELKLYIAIITTILYLPERVWSRILIVQLTVKPERVLMKRREVWEIVLMKRREVWEIVLMKRREVWEIVLGRGGRCGGECW